MDSNSTFGEKRLFGLLEKYFNSDDTIIYYECKVIDGKPDFLCLSPQFGVIVIEIKDFKSETIKNDPQLAKKPSRQLYKYWKDVKARIRMNPKLNQREPEITLIIVYSNMNENSEVSDYLVDSKGSYDKIFFKNHITNINKFTERMDKTLQGVKSTDKAILDLLHANVIPTVRLPTRKQPKLDKWLTEEDVVKILDIEQIKLAHQLGEGHRIFYGVAGSGKTILLVARTKFLSKIHPKWEILVLCYNKVLSKYLEDLIRPQDLGNVEISTFHSFARRMIRSGPIAYSAAFERMFDKCKEKDDLDTFYSEICPDLLIQVSEAIEPKCFDAILIDEGQDFEASWYESILKFLNPTTKSLMIALDGLQGIYARKKIVWSHLGIDARGRVIKFYKSYRYAKEVGEAAARILPENLINLINSDDDFLATEEFLGANGSCKIAIYTNRREEYDEICNLIGKIKEKHHSILILTRYNLQNYQNDNYLLRILAEHDIDYDFVSNWGSNGYRTYLSTVHSAKGLEADAVIIPQIDKFDVEIDAQLLYVGMTRAKKQLILTGIKETTLVKKIGDTTH